MTITRSILIFIVAVAATLMIFGPVDAREIPDDLYDPLDDVYGDRKPFQRQYGFMPVIHSAVIFGCAAFRECLQLRVTAPGNYDTTPNGTGQEFRYFWRPGYAGNNGWNQDDGQRCWYMPASDNSQDTIVTCDVSELTWRARVGECYSVRILVNGRVPREVANDINMNAISVCYFR